MNPIVNLKFVFIFLMFSGLCPVLHGQDSTFRVYGEIRVPRSDGIILIYIIDREYFEIPLAGLYTIVLKASSNMLEYEFRDLPNGTYGIKCFQDLNGNGKLDRGLFGPSEPWALSWKESLSGGSTATIYFRS